MCSDDEVIYDIINTLDNCVSSNFGHINLVVNNESIEKKDIKLSNTSSCSLGDTACKIPTLDYNDNVEN